MKQDPFRLRFQADVLDKVALLKERDGHPNEAAADRRQAEELRRQAFKIEETGR